MKGTMQKRSLRLSRRGFNPRIHEGYDQHDFFTNEKLPFNSFNPRTREGYDMIVSVNNSIILCFNPRTREGYDTIDRGVNVSIYHFNPRTREGYDNTSNLKYYRF